MSLDTSGSLAHWRVTTPPGGLTTAVDIVTWKPVGAGDDWRSEPIVDPVTLEPGTSALLPLVVDEPESAHLVVVAWTVKHPGGDVQGSRTLTVGTTSPVAPTAMRLHRGTGLVRLIAASLLAGFLVILVLVAGWRFVDGDGSSVSAPAGADDRGDEAVGSTEQLPRPTDPPSTPTSAPTTRPTTTPATTSSTGTTTATSDTVSSTAGSTTPTDTQPPTTAGPSSTAVAVSTTAAGSDTSPTTTATTTAPTTAPGTAADRRVDIRGRVEDCRFGSDCLIASFSAVGFPTEGDYVCEFEDGTRFTFRYAGGGALDACSTAGASPSITIEVDGVRSATITRDTVEGA